jgi:hypothetical protein
MAHQASVRQAAQQVDNAIARCCAQVLRRSRPRQCWVDALLLRACCPPCATPQPHSPKGLVASVACCVRVSINTIRNRCDHRRSSPAPSWVTPMGAAHGTPRRRKGVGLPRAHSAAWLVFRGGRGPGNRPIAETFSQNPVGCREKSCRPVALADRPNTPAVVEPCISPTAAVAAARR